MKRSKIEHLNLKKFKIPDIIHFLGIVDNAYTTITLSAIQVMELLRLRVTFRL
jgi:hypothetical protein